MIAHARTRTLFYDKINYPGSGNLKMFLRRLMFIRQAQIKSLSKIPRLNFDDDLNMFNFAQHLKLHSYCIVPGAEEVHLNGQT